MKLSFNEWKKQYVSVPQEAVDKLKEFHNLNAEHEIDIILKQLYDDYLQE